MRKARLVIFAALFGMLLAIGATQTPTVPLSEAAGGKVAVKDHWRYHDGHWSFWHAADRRWYFTDGSHWFYNDNLNPTWHVYAFDKGFGREGFERGEYKAPGLAVKIALPNHGFFKIKL